MRARTRNTFGDASGCIFLQIVDLYAHPLGKERSKAHAQRVQIVDLFTFGERKGSKGIIVGESITCMRNKSRNCRFDAHTSCVCVVPPARRCAKLCKRKTRGMLLLAFSRFSRAQQVRHRGWGIRVRTNRKFVHGMLSRALVHLRQDRANKSTICTPYRTNRKFDALLAFVSVGHASRACNT